ncbi:MAG: hypothetical protein H8D63_00795, partial [Parcubacteria group bacterium]|nr:hypothetical protein [Parcubacteria group bacterium]
MTFSTIQHNTALRTGMALVTVFALVVSVLSPVVLPQVAHADYYSDYGYDSYDYYYDDYYYDDDSYGYDSYDYYYDDYYYDHDGYYDYGDDWGYYDDSNYYNTTYDYDWGYDSYGYYDYDYGYDYGYDSYDYYDDWGYDYGYGYDDYYYEDTTYVYEDYYYYDSCYYDPCGCDGCYDPCDNGGCDDDADRPDVDTLSAINIDEDSATLRCDVNPNNDDTDVWFEYGEDSSMDEDTSKRSIGDGDDEERVSRSISGLDEDTKYYFRCVAENDEGKTYGDTKTLYTDDNGGADDRPDVETLSAQDIDEDSATLRCDVDINADEAEIWFEYGEDSGMDEDTSKRTIDDDDNEYERTVTGLDEDEKYYFRCVAENDEGKTYGDTKTFTTDDDEPEGDRPRVETLSATDITEDSARLRCDVDPNDSDTDVWFEYGETTSMNDDTYKQYVDGDDRSERVDKIISGLDARTTYYFRCVADNEKVTTYGSLQTFTTDNGGVTVRRTPTAIPNAA